MWLWGLVYLATRVLVRLDTDVKCRVLVYTQSSNSFKMCTVWLKSELWAGHLSAPKASLANKIFMNLSLPRCISIWTPMAGVGKGRGVLILLNSRIQKILNNNFYSQIKFLNLGSQMCLMSKCNLLSCFSFCLFFVFLWILNKMFQHQFFKKQAYMPSSGFWCTVKE